MTDYTLLIDRLKNPQRDERSNKLRKEAADALEALQAKLDELQRQEPVGTVSETWAHWPAKGDVTTVDWVNDTPPPVGTELYTAPKALELVADGRVYETSIQWDEGGGKRSRRELARRIEALYAAPKAQRPIYAFRRKGLDDFCTCSEERYLELSDKPNLFEVTKFYAAPKALEPTIDIQALQAVSEEYNAWIRYHAAGGDYDGFLKGVLAKQQAEDDVGADCTPNHNCNGRMVHLPDGEHCDHCGITKGTPA